MTSNGNGDVQGHPVGDNASSAIKQSDVHLTNVQERLPPFWKRNFRLLLSCRSTVSTAPYNIKLDRSSHASSCTRSTNCATFWLLHQVRAPPSSSDASHKYKFSVLHSKTESESGCLRQLFNTEGRGDQRPSQHPHRIRHLLGERPSKSPSSVH